MPLYGKRIGTRVHGRAADVRNHGGGEIGMGASSTSGFVDGGPDGRARNSESTRQTDERPGIYQNRSKDNAVSRTLVVERWDRT